MADRGQDMKVSFILRDEGDCQFTQITIGGNEVSWFICCQGKQVRSTTAYHPFDRQQSRWSYSKYIGTYRLGSMIQREKSVL